MAERRMAICYDFDRTLAPDDMQSFTFIPSLGMAIEDFWKESNAMAAENGMDRNLAWMRLMIEKAKLQSKSISRSAFRQLGQGVKLYQGVEEWFDAVNRYAASKEIEVEHYIISSGLKEIIEGSCIAHHFKRIYASTFFYDEKDIACWPAQAINYTNKTQYIFRIAKGAFDENDEAVNQNFADEQLHIPYENMIYIGDSETDIPCMKLVKSKGGYAIGVFDPERNHRRRIYELFNDGRINFFAPADYRQQGELFGLMQKIINSIDARETLKAVSNLQSRKAQQFALYKSAEGVLNGGHFSGGSEILSALRQKVEGNIE